MDETSGSVEDLPGAKPRNRDPFKTNCTSSSILHSFFFVCFFPFSFFLHHLSPVLLEGCERKAAHVTHYFQQRTCCTETRGETVSISMVCLQISSEAILSDHKRTDGGAEHLWLSSPPHLLPASAPNMLFFSCCGLNPRRKKNLI